MNKQELYEYSYYGMHNHSEFSNMRLLDATMSPKKLIDTAYKLGLKGIAITDHETLSAHIKLATYLKSQQDQGKMKDFKLMFGDEIYLVSKKQIEKARENNEKTRFFHFILIAKNERGYEFLRKKSTQAWKNSFWFRGMQRVPTYKDELKEMMKDYKGDVIASTACIGSEMNQLSLEIYDECADNDGELDIEKVKKSESFKKVCQYIKFMQDVFGKDNFYLELQPSHHRDQLIVNKLILLYSKWFDIRYEITTDAHYARPEDAPIHETFLKSRNSDRDVSKFYATTYLFSPEELSEYFSDDIMTNAFKTTHDIASQVEHFTFYHNAIIPRAKIPEKFLSDNPLIKLRSVEVLVGSLEKQGLSVKQYKYIYKYLSATNPSDKYYMYLILNGLFDKVENITEKHLERIDIELEQIYEISNQINQRMSGYFLAELDFMNEMWKVSILGPARGSAACFYTNYLLGIVQVDALKYDLKWWRFLSKERIGDFPDIDIDGEAIKRQDIMNQLRKSYGENKIIKICTFSTMTDSAAIEAACRGLGIDSSVSSNLKDILQDDSVKDAFFGNEKKEIKPNEEFCNTVKKYPKLKEMILGLYGLVSGRSEHASGMLCFNDSDDGWVAHNAMMTTTKGLPVTQLDATDSEYCGGIKYDMLSISALGRIDCSMKALLQNGKIEWQGDLRKTYEKYFQPDKLNFTDKKIYELFAQNEIPELFQFSTKVGFGVLKKLKAKSFQQTASANSLMRLTVKDGEQPVDKYIHFRDNPGLWEKEMIDQGLSKDERQLLHDELDSEFGICVTQEELMSIAMNKKVSGYNLLEANKLRKAVAKKSSKLQQQQKKIFFEKGRALGTSDNLLNYVWNYCFKIQFAYSFNGAHVVSYTLVSFIEANICARYGIEYWVAGCLSIDSGSWDDNSKTDKVKFPQAVSKFISRVQKPSINESDLGFKVNNDKILFGLRTISGLNGDDCRLIIENRNFEDFDDFQKKMSDKLSNRQIINIIKSGACDEFGDRRNLMKSYIVSTIKDRKSMSIVSVPKYKDVIPDKYQKQVFLQIVKKNFCGKRKIEMDKKWINILVKTFGQDIISFDDSGKAQLNEEAFSKIYDENMVEFKKWLKSDKAVKIQKAYLAMSDFKDRCYGNIYQWEMDALGCFVDDSVVAPIKKDLFIRFSIENFQDLQSSDFKGKRSNIVGTIVDYKNNGTLSVIDNNMNIVFVRIGKNAFQALNEKIIHGKGKNKVVVKDSWITRGNTFVFHGFRRDDEFCAYGIENSVLIQFNSNGNQYRVKTIKE